jgi:hypothetical protein
MLNQPLSMMLNGGTATMGGVEDGMVKVVYSSPNLAAAGVQEQAFLFDDANLLRKQKLRVSTESAMGAMQVEVDQSMSWKPVSEGSDLLIADHEEVLQDLGMMKVKTSASFGSQMVNGIVLITTMTRITDLPPQAGGGTQTVSCENLLVNGAPLPAAAPAQPASEDAAGG